ncbi:testis-specific gene 10 protein isoform X1 [Pseudophryne corroboree]|uniref:testis-specific gene 10 protein isoform X1 n=2 Tax=Pseudophryne corroboree TaxID=495146 RepID=UPI00308175F8
MCSAASPSRRKDHLWSSLTGICDDHRSHLSRDIALPPVLGCLAGHVSPLECVTPVVSAPSGITWGWNAGPMPLVHIDELQNTNRGLEHQILFLTENKEAVSNHVDTLTRKNEQLCEELTEIDKLAEQLENEKQQALNVAEQKLEEEQNEVRRQQKNIENLELTIKTIKSDADNSKEHLQKALTELEEKSQENRTISLLFDQLQEDNNRLSKKIEKIEKHEKKSILASEKNKAMCPSKLDSFVKSLEAERDHYKRETEHLRKMLRGRSGSPTRSPSRLDSGVKRSIRERDELQNMLTKYERHMAEIQANVKVLTSERDKTNALYERAQQEITHLRRELMRSPKTPKTSVTTQNILRRVESERDRAMSDFRRMTTERDSLRERLKIAQETAISDRAHLEQRIEELQSTIQTMESERVDQKSKLSLMKDSMSSMENEMKILTRRAVDMENDLRQQKSECDSMRLLNNKTENSLEEAQRRLSLKLHDLLLAQETIVRLEGKIEEESNRNLVHQEEITILQKTIAELDKEKDNLLYSMDQKAEKISSLEDSLAVKENNIQRMLREMEESARQSSKTVNSHEQEISRLRRQLDEISDELSRTGREKEIVVQENSGLYDQLSKNKVDIQTLTHKLKDSQDELQDSKLKLQGAKTDIMRHESLMASKEKENRDLLENYRRTSSQAEMWESKFHQLEKEFSSVKLELLDAESEHWRLKERVDSLDLECEKHINSEQSYKSHISSLTKSVGRMEEELRQAKAEKSSALSDLASTRELCVKLDSGKEMINRQLCAKTQDVERLQQELESSCSEVELLRKQIATERITVKNLEALLASNQEKEYKSEVRVQELDSELQLLGDRLMLAESKLGAHSREAGHLKNKIAQQEAELEITRRHLSTERFERELAVKELRRQNYQTASTFGRSLSPSRLSPEQSFRSPDRHSRSTEKSIDRSHLFRDY